MFVLYHLFRLAGCLLTQQTKVLPFIPENPSVYSPLSIAWQRPARKGDYEISWPTN